jgi:hypothetical protein
VFDYEPLLHLCKRQPVTLTVKKTTDRLVPPITTLCDLRGLSCSHSDVFVCESIQILLNCNHQ